MRIAYLRVSTADQDAALQRAAVEVRDPDIILEDVESGLSQARPAWQDLLERIQAGQVSQVIVYRLDRLGRDPVPLIEFFNLLEDHQVQFCSCTEPALSSWNTSPISFLTWWLQLGLARFELLQLKERQRAGIDAARRAGKHLGRPRKDES